MGVTVRILQSVSALRCSFRDPDDLFNSFGLFFFTDLSNCGSTAGTFPLKCVFWLVNTSWDFPPAESNQN